MVNKNNHWGLILHTLAPRRGRFIVGNKPFKSYASFLHKEEATWKGYSYNYMQKKGELILSGIRNIFAFILLTWAQTENEST